MKRKLTALLLAVLTLCLCTGAMAAGYPIDTQGKDVSLTVYCANAISNYVTDYNETPFLQEMEKATGIHINFIHPATSGMQEAMNLLFLGKELPDISSQTYKAVEEKFAAWKKEAGTDTVTA